MFDGHVLLLTSCRKDPSCYPGRSSHFYLLDSIHEFGPHQPPTFRNIKKKRGFPRFLKAVFRAISGRRPAARR
ncbi:hypothetical protein B8V81_2222 [Paenibacillus pasadenensis]|uniref:Uncharacterized protein n=1 Tax=Paenibacillus pasadenensis TaxID=217090 RepID=A0A2N5N0D0_9BACL|nr:hypothetical protein B8V81_2222 [Paenibacillus pasadenensis]